MKIAAATRHSPSRRTPLRELPRHRNAPQFSSKTAPDPPPPSASPSHSITVSATPPQNPSSGLAPFLWRTLRRGVAGWSAKPVLAPGGAGPRCDQAASARRDPSRKATAPGGAPANGDQTLRPRPTTSSEPAIFSITGVACCFKISVSESWPPTGGTLCIAAISKQRMRLSAEFENAGSTRLFQEIPRHGNAHQLSSKTAPDPPPPSAASSHSITATATPPQNDSSRPAPFRWGTLRRAAV